MESEISQMYPVGHQTFGAVSVSSLASLLPDAFLSFSSRITRICHGIIPLIPPPSIDRMRISFFFVLTIAVKIKYGNDKEQRNY